MYDLQITLQLQRITRDGVYASLSASWYEHPVTFRGNDVISRSKVERFDSVVEAQNLADEMGARFIGFAQNAQPFLSELGFAYDCDIQQAVDNGATVYAINFPAVNVGRVGDYYVMRGPKGEHRISADRKVTDSSRFSAHWRGFKSNNGAI